MNADEKFGPVRKILWPIHNYELKKFLPLSLIMFCLVFNYTLLRDIKDTLVVNAAGAGIIPFLKFWGVMPTAILFVIFYIKLNNMLKKEYIFYIISIMFLIFFGVFALLIYPNINILHPSAEWINQAYKNLPVLRGFINVIGYWTYAIFYVAAEIWGSSMITLMFWQLANQIVKMHESKRFYGLFVVISNMALIFSGKCLKFCSQGIKQYLISTDTDVWQISLYLMMGIIIIMGIVAMSIYRWIHINILTDPFYYDAVMQKNIKQKNMSLKNSLYIILRSPELGLITILLISYGVTINLIEVQWKEQVKIYFGSDKNAYAGFMGDYSFWSGIFTIIFGLFISSNILRIFSWYKSAIITPIFIFIGGSIFFCFVLSMRFPIIKDFVASTLMIAVEKQVIIATFLGVVIVAFGKTVKYTLFDPTKEMAYIPLNEEIKTIGKAAVDVIGGRAGKSGGACIQSMLMIILGTINVIEFAHITFIIFIIICVCWIFAVKILSKKVEAAISRQTKFNSKKKLPYVLK
jgi:AAA family ATP:ADP antiporter